jgi:RNA polymerase sigma factor (sigma-70 family)
MSDPKLEFAALIERASHGSEEAFQQLVDRYSKHVLRVVRARMNRRVREHFDSQDFVQSIWARFYEACANGRVFDTPESLIFHLVQIARNRVVDAGRRLKTDKLSAGSLLRLGNEIEEEAIPEPRGKTPTPSEVAIGKERWASLLDGVNGRDHEILKLIGTGGSHAEVAAETGLSERTVRRVVDEAIDRIRV